MANSLSCSWTSMMNSLGSRFVSCLFLVELLAPRPSRWDCNLEPQRGPLCKSCGVYSPSIALKGCTPTPLRSCLAVRELFCPQLRKKCTTRTSLGTNKGTSLGFHPTVTGKKKRLSHSKKNTNSSSSPTSTVVCQLPML